MRKIIRNILTKWCLKHFPLKMTTKNVVLYKVYVKKGKIREWRLYDENYNRLIF